jgi:hypothetical protein
MAINLLSNWVLRHRIIDGIDFTSFLDDGAARTEPVKNAIVAKRSWNSSLFSYFSSNFSLADDVCDRNESQAAVQAT